MPQVSHLTFSVASTSPLERFEQSERMLLRETMRGEHETLILTVDLDHNGEGIGPTQTWRVVTSSDDVRDDETVAAIVEPYDGEHEYEGVVAHVSCAAHRHGL